MLRNAGQCPKLSEQIGTPTIATFCSCPSYTPFPRRRPHPLPSPFPTNLKFALGLELVKRKNREADEKRTVDDGHKHSHGNDVRNTVVYSPAHHGYTGGSPREWGVGPEGRIVVGGMVCVAAVGLLLVSALVEALESRRRRRGR